MRIPGRAGAFLDPLARATDMEFANLICRRLEHAKNAAMIHPSCNGVEVDRIYSSASSTPFKFISINRMLLE